MQFEMLSILAQEIQEMKVRLGQLVADTAEKQELAGLLSISQASCRVCRGRASGRHAQGDDFEERSVSSDYESQPPY